MQIRGPGLLRANECFLGRKKARQNEKGMLLVLPGPESERQLQAHSHVPSRGSGEVLRRISVAEIEEVPWRRVVHNNGRHAAAQERGEVKILVVKHVEDLRAVLQPKPLAELE